jgi:hypothetical protein
MIGGAMASLTWHIGAVQLNRADRAALVTLRVHLRIAAGLAGDVVIPCP